MKPLLAVLALSLAALSASAQDGPDQKPSVFLQNNRTKSEKPSTTLIIDGTVKDAAGNPIADAIVQMKNTKTSNVVEFVTKDDGKYAFRDRRARKRQFRRLWIIRISAACRMRGIRYSQFICGLTNALVSLDRKSLADIAIHDPETFTKLVELAKANMPKELK